jgi:MFS family permease
MAFIDGTVVNVALPAIQEKLKASVIDVQWVIEAYALLLTALLLVGGSLGDRYGRRRIFVFGTVIFTIASAWCGLAHGVRELIAARAAQGLGAALLVPASLAIISASFSNADRGRAIGTWSGFTAITTAIGPVIGGFFPQPAAGSRSGNHYLAICAGKPRPGRKSISRLARRRDHNARPDLARLRLD